MKVSKTAKRVPHDVKELAAEAVAAHPSMKGDRYALARVLTHWKIGILSTQNIREGKLV